LNQTRINTHETLIIPSPTLIPRVSLRDLLLTQTRRLLSIRRGNISRERRNSRPESEPDGAVVPGCVAGEDEVARLRVVGEAIVGVAEGDAVCDNVVCGADVCVVAAAELVAVAVAFEGGEAPS
jgi:hypothetical protein